MNPNDSAPWIYSGDVSLEYGGTFVDPSDSRWGYAEVVEVTDLDSACGFSGAVLIERGSAILPRSRKTLRRALQSYGITILDLLALPKSARRAELFRALWSYGHRDIERTEVIQVEEDGPMVYDGWKADKRISADDLPGYLAARWL